MSAWELYYLRALRDFARKAFRDGSGADWRSLESWVFLPRTLDEREQDERMGRALRAWDEATEWRNE